jgi:hypothetical protein
VAASIDDLKEHDMVKKQKGAKAPQLGKQDRWPSDYGVRDSEREATKRSRHGKGRELDAR